MNQNISGGVSNVNEDTGMASFVSQTQNKLINVCKSCGETDYLWKTEAEYKDHLRKEEQQAIAKKREEEQAWQTNKQHRIQNPHRNAIGTAFTGLWISFIILIAGLFVLNLVGLFLHKFFTGEYKEGMVISAEFGLIFSVLIAVIVAIYFYSTQVNINKKLIKLERQQKTQ